ncbi:sigma-70 family RNA polymerase sigma factor [Streptomyces sp. FZ201]|uniref:sigma-70 family RNA polymerase sigma factor n=1 Tax=Streptomyces sp. FZ201 TaxID=3057122 RepID=UPI0021C218A8|nr:sigma-70 family RNA polymerase sigma factor [Streptomyces sp. FZ201]
MNPDAAPRARLRHLGGDGPRPRDFEEFYTQYFSSLIAQASRYADDRETAADAVQDALIDVFRRWDSIDNPAAYAGTAVRRTIWSHQQIRQTAQLSALAPDSSAFALDASGRIIDYVTLVTCLKDLPDMQRTITALYYFEGWKISDIAARLQIAEGTARAHLVHARRRLRQLLAPRPSSTATTEPHTNPTPEAVQTTPAPAPTPTVQRAQAGNSDAFTDLYDEHADTIYRYLYLRLGSRKSAEDLTARTFHRALHTINEFTGKHRDFGSWLVAIARRLVAGEAGDSEFHLKATAEDLLAHAPRALTITPSGQHSRILQAMAELSPPQQECLTLRFLAGLSVSETARAMGKREGAIRTLQHRALRALDRTLTAEADLWSVLHDVGAHCTKAAQPTTHAHQRIRARAGVQ